jgi:hypothetical protein
MKIVPFELCMALTGAKAMQRGGPRGPREVLRWVYLPESVAPEFRIVYIDRDGILHLTGEDGLYMPQPVAGQVESPEDLVLWVEDDLHTTAPISDGFTDQRDEDAADQDYCDRAIAL